MCLRVSSSCVSCPIRICSFWFSSCSCMALCWVIRILLRALSRLFLTAMLFLSRRRRYSTLSLLMLLLVTGARRVGRRKGEKSCRSECHTCLSYGGEGYNLTLIITLRSCVRITFLNLLSTNQKPLSNLLSVGVALVVVCAPGARGVAETGRRVRQVRHSHHLFSHSVLTTTPHQSLRLAVWDHVHLSQLIGRTSQVGSVGVQGLGMAVAVGLTWVRAHPLLDDRGHPGIRHLSGLGNRMGFKFKLFF